MLPIDLKIDRTQRLLRMIEEDAPLLAVRVAPLSRELQKSARAHAKELASKARAELNRLLQEKNLADTTELIAPASD